MTTGKMAEKPGHRLLATQTAYAGWAKLLIATIRLADGHTVEREIEDHGEAEFDGGRVFVFAGDAGAQFVPRITCIAA